jgi:hypothetical protein
MKMVLNEITKNYMLKMLDLYYSNKLSEREKVQLWQDLYDSSFYIELGDYYIAMVRGLVAKGILVESLSHSIDASRAH